jgi:hypothetical protein
MLAQRELLVDPPAVAEAYNGLGASIEMSHTRLDEAVWSEYWRAIKALLRLYRNVAFFLSFF